MTLLRDRSIGGPKARQTTARLHSLDALRGFDMFWIIGGDALVHSFAALTGWRVATLAAQQMSHVAWDGFRFYDLIFPLFIFISGVAMPYSLSRRVEDGARRGDLVVHVARRGLLLVLLGIVYNNGFFQISFAEMRYPSVLGRIGLAYIGAALIVLYFGVRAQVVWLVGLLLGYWMALTLIPVPDIGAGVLTPEGSLVGYVDRALLPGTLFGGGHDPEGLLSTVPAVGTGLAGALVGHFLRTSPRPRTQQAALVAATGVGALALGWLWGLLLPVNKNLWTSSFVLITAGWSMLALALFFYVIDARGWRRWSFFFIVIGANSILIYLAGRVIDFGHATNFFLDGPLRNVSEQTATVLWWMGFIAVEWIFLWFLYRRRIFLRV